MPVGSLPTLGSTFLASSSNSPASILRSRPLSIAAGERSQSSAAADVLTFMSRCDTADGQAARLRGTTLDPLGSQVLVEALGDLYEQAGRALCTLQQVEYQGQHTRHLLGLNDDRDLTQHVNGLYAFVARDARPWIIDCGANVGMSVLFFKALYPAASVIAIEPDRAAFDRLSGS